MKQGKRHTQLNPLWLRLRFGKTSMYEFSFNAKVIAVIHNSHFPTAVQKPWCLFLQAALAIAVTCGCEIFTSTGSEEETSSLKSMFPRLKDRNFCKSTDVSFERHIKSETNGKGCDYCWYSIC